MLSSGAPISSAASCRAIMRFRNNGRAVSASNIGLGLTFLVANREESVFKAAAELHTVLPRWRRSSSWDKFKRLAAHGNRWGRSPVPLMMRLMSFRYTRRRVNISSSDCSCSLRKDGQSRKFSALAQGSPDVYSCWKINHQRSWSSKNTTEHAPAVERRHCSTDKFHLSGRGAGHRGAGRRPQQ